MLPLSLLSDSAGRTGTSAELGYCLEMSFFASVLTFEDAVTDEFSEETRRLRLLMDLFSGFKKKRKKEKNPTPVTGDFGQSQHSSRSRPSLSSVLQIKRLHKALIKMHDMKMSELFSFERTKRPRRGSPVVQAGRAYFGDAPEALPSRERQGSLDEPAVGIRCEIVNLLSSTAEVT